MYNHHILIHYSPLLSKCDSHVIISDLLSLSSSDVIRLWNNNYVLLLEVSMSSSLYGCCFLPIQACLILSIHNHLYKLMLANGTPLLINWIMYCIRKLISATTDRVNATKRNCRNSSCYQCFW